MCMTNYAYELATNTESSKMEIIIRRKVVTFCKSATEVVLHIGWKLPRL